MKAYLVATGALFGVIALAHFARTVAEWSRLGDDPWFYLEGPGLGVVAGALAGWAWRVHGASGPPRERHQNSTETPPRTP